MVLEKIISGGQVGVDRLGLDVAIQSGIAIGGYIPKGGRALDGKVPEKYAKHMVELTTKGYPTRTKKNIEKSDGTLICSYGKIKGGSKLTATHAAKIGKPCLTIDLSELTRAAAKVMVTGWLRRNNIKVLNIAGPSYRSDKLNLSIIKEFLETVFAVQ